MSQSNAQAALAAAALVHQKVAAGSGAGAGGSGYSSAKGDIKIDKSSGPDVLATAQGFYEWLQDRSL